MDYRASSGSSDFQAAPRQVGNRKCPPGSPYPTPPYRTHTCTWSGAQLCQLDRLCSRATGPELWVHWAAGLWDLPTARPNHMVRPNLG